MKLTILGSGSAFNSQRNPSGYAVDLGGRLVLFDLGFGNLRQLTRAKLKPEAITDVFISHRHPDHVGDLAALLFLFRYDVKPATGTLRLWGPRGFADFSRKLQEAHEPWCGARGYALEVRELSGGGLIRRDGWTIDTLAVPHPTPALAYRLSYKGKTLVYSGDTDFCPPLADFAAEADLFLLECASGERELLGGHLTPRLALATILASRCRRALLTHLSRPALADLARLRRPKNVGLAKDLQTVKL